MSSKLEFVQVLILIKVVLNSVILFKRLNTQLPNLF